MQIPVVDIFAGPGGLGEGFSAFAPVKSSKRPAFQISVSAEMESNAAKTLRLRAFFRQFPVGHVPSSYYEYIAGRCEAPWSEATRKEWDSACNEALQLKLGDHDDDAILSERIKKTTKTDEPWVLIGGPPCQAYSLVGRSRNQGVLGYKAEADHRHFLYKHYLQIIKEYRPAVFVMENVKGILSSRVGGELMFPKILEDLSMPGGKKGPRYNVMPLILAPGEAADLKTSNYILHAEELGVPQARHRVVLLGVSEDIQAKRGNYLKPTHDRFNVSDVIRGLPRLRSGVTNVKFDRWSEIASGILSKTAKTIRREQPEAAEQLEKASQLAARQRDPGMGGRWMPKASKCDLVPDHLKSWYLDDRLDGLLNHEVRSHMREDLMRYAFAASFAKVHGHSPRGASEFPLSLHPNHKNWESGKFVDRFKVQRWDAPSSTITSHLSKDGHYFIHPDPIQLRSLSVREAARLQTFPDNYFFEGSRGAQYRQVGNAVPPWMARQIAATVYSLLA